MKWVLLFWAGFMAQVANTLVFSSNAELLAWRRRVYGPEYEPAPAFYTRIRVTGYAIMFGCAVAFVSVLVDD